MAGRLTGSRPMLQWKEREETEGIPALRNRLSRDPDRLTVSTYRGPFGGLVLLSVGLVVLTAPWWCGVGFSALHLFFGGLLLLLGLAAIVVREKSIFDRRERVMIDCLNILGWSRRKTHPFDELGGVKLTAIQWKSSVEYVAQVVNPDGRMLTRITRTFDLKEARARAEEVARFAGLKMIDETTGTPVVREGAEVDESLRDRAARTGVDVNLPPQPPEARTTYTLREDTIILEIPPRGPGMKQKLGYAAAAFCVALYVVLLALILTCAKEADPGSVPAFAAFLAFILIGVPAFLVALSYRNVTKRWRIEASPRELRVLVRGFLRKGETVLPADTIEELSVVAVNQATMTDGAPAEAQGERLILARSDTARVSFADGLSDDELVWLKAVIEKTVSI